jgi:hypothetical protein
MLARHGEGPAGYIFQSKGLAFLDAQQSTGQVIRVNRDSGPQKMEI